MLLEFREVEVDRLIKHREVEKVIGEDSEILKNGIMKFKNL